jgi:hypothetical protein
MGRYALTAHGVGWTDELTTEFRPDTEPLATWLAERRTVDINVEQFDWTGREGIYRNVTAAGLKHACFVPLATPRETSGVLVLNRRSPAPFTRDEMNWSCGGAWTTPCLYFVTTPASVLRQSVVPVRDRHADTFNTR